MKPDNHGYRVGPKLNEPFRDFQSKDWLWGYGGIVAVCVTWGPFY